MRPNTSSNLDLFLDFLIDSDDMRKRTIVPFRGTVYYFPIQYIGWVANN